MRKFFLLLFSLVLIGLPILFGIVIFRELRMEFQTSKAKEQLHQLATLSVHVFANGDPTEAGFWHALQDITPLKDPWGNAYKMTPTKNTVTWASAGPDGIINTSDDLKITVPVAVTLPGHATNAEGVALGVIPAK